MWHKAESVKVTLHFGSISSRVGDILFTSPQGNSKDGSSSTSVSNSSTSASGRPLEETLQFDDCELAYLLRQVADSQNDLPQRVSHCKREFPFFYVLNGFL